MAKACKKGRPKGSKNREINEYSKGGGLLIPNPSGNYFNGFGNSYLKTGVPMQTASITTPTTPTLMGPKTGLSAPDGGFSDLSKNAGPGVAEYGGAALQVAQGGMELYAQGQKRFDTSSVERAKNYRDIQRADILKGNKIEYQKNSVGGAALESGMTGAGIGASIGTVVGGPVGTLIGGAAGGAIGAGYGAITASMGNDDRDELAKQQQKQSDEQMARRLDQFNREDSLLANANVAANGGDLFAYGGNVKPQLTEFNAGNTHENNPNGGVMQGTGANGKPNLVEQGETKHEDYIFSDRLKVNPKIIEQYKLPAGLKGKTFADASKHLNREAKDRPNDPISNKGVKAHLAMLTAAQEGLKEQMQPHQPQQGIPTEGQPNANMLAQGQQGIPSQGGIDPKLEYAFGGSMFYPHTTEAQEQNGRNFQFANGGLATNMGSGIGVLGFANGGDISHEKDNAFGNYPQNINLGYYAHGGYKTYDSQENTANAIPTYANGGDMTHYNNALPQGYQVYANGGNVFAGPFGKVQGSQLTGVPYVNKNFSITRLDEPAYTSLSDTNGFDSSKSIDNFKRQLASNRTIDSKFRVYSPIAKAPEEQEDAINFGPPEEWAAPKEKSFVGRSASVMAGAAGKGYDYLKGIDVPDIDYARYAPAFANFAAGLSDIGQEAEVVEYGRYAPERNKAHMDYQPVDTEWMANKMKSSAAGMRESVVQAAAGNRGAAMSGLAGINRQTQDALGEAYLKANDVNYGRRKEANTFNAAIEAQNVDAANKAQQLNLQYQQLELDANAKARAAKRNALRGALMNMASNIGDIGRENFNANTVKSATGYGADAHGYMKYLEQKNK